MYVNMDPPTHTPTHTHRHTGDILTIGRYINPSIGNIQLASLSSSRISQNPTVLDVGNIETDAMMLPKETVSANKEERLTMGLSLYLL